jgi:hypothetical protein
MINLNSDLISVPQTLSGAAAAGVAKVTKDMSEQVDESPTYFGAAEAVDVEVESKVEQLEVVGNSSENLKAEVVIKLELLNFALNFYIYCLCSAEIRRAFVNLFRHILCNFCHSCCCCSRKCLRHRDQVTVQVDHV